MSLDMEAVKARLRACLDDWEAHKGTDATELFDDHDMGCLRALLTENERLTLIYAETVDKARLEEEVARLTAEVERLSRPSTSRSVSDHHAHDRGRRARTSKEIRDHINSDHPCCIPVGDAVALLHENKELSEDRYDALHSLAHCVPGRKAALAEVKRLKADLAAALGHIEACKTNEAKLRERAEQAEAALVAAQKLIAVHEAWEQDHREAHERAVDDCPHGEKTWTCCATCHCVAMQKLAAANERAEKLLEIAMDCAPTRTREALRPAAPPEVVHQCPPKGSGIMPCCGKTPFEALNDRMTLDPALVTCRPAAPEKP